MTSAQRKVVPKEIATFGEVQVLESQLVVNGS